MCLKLRGIRYYNIKVFCGNQDIVSWYQKGDSNVYIFGEVIIIYFLCIRSEMDQMISGNTKFQLQKQAEHRRYDATNSTDITNLTQRTIIANLKLNELFANLIFIVN